MGDSSGGRDRERDRERDRDWERDREREMLMMAENQESHNLYSPAPLSPLRSEEFDYQQSNITLLKAQLKLVTHERDMLKKDLKRISQERDGAYRHLSLSTSPHSSLDSSSHHRTNSDTVPSMSKSGMISTLSRSHSIAAAGDKSLVLSTSRSLEVETSPERFLQELQMLRKQHSDGLKKLEQAMKDVDYYRQEAETLRTRYNEGVLENQRLDQEVNNLRRYMEEDRKEIDDMRREQQEILSLESGGESMSIMYGTLLRKYESVKDDFGLVNQRYEDLVSSHSSALAKLEHCQEECMRYKKQYEDILTERNKFKQQCTQAIRQWDAALRERNDYRDALAKVQRQHEEAVKEINQAMAVRIKASKDIKRLTEERNAAMQEYTMIMSERDSVHKEIEKLQEEVSNKNTRMNHAEARTKTQEEEKRKLVCQIELLRREIDAALIDRDRALKESHDLREKLGERDKTAAAAAGKSSIDFDSRRDYLSRMDLDKHKMFRESTEQVDKETDKQADKNSKVETLEQALLEIERLEKQCEKLNGDLQDLSMEADVAKGRRDFAISERDKVVLERESIRTLCDKHRRERDRAVSELAEALRDLDESKKSRNEVKKENKELRERVDSLEKEGRMRLLQRSIGQNQSRDSAIDTDLQEWETETMDIDFGSLNSEEDLGLDLAGGRDDPICPGENPIYVSSINKGSVVEGKLKINDYVLFVNNLDCRDVDRATVLATMRQAGAGVVIVVRRRKTGRRYQANLQLARRGEHGLTLETGIYISRISPGSVAARESMVAVGDRVQAINDTNMDNIKSAQAAMAVLNSCGDVLTLTLQKSMSSPSCGPLSSSSSGHIVWEDKFSSPKTYSTATSPIKETLRYGSTRDLVKKFISRDAQTEKYPLLSSSSSERVYSVTKAGSRESRSPWGHLADTVREKLDTVRGRRHSKEQSDRERQEHSDNSMRRRKERTESKYLDQDSVEALSELERLDNVLNSYQTMSKSTSGSGKKKRKERESFKNGGTWPRTRGGPVIQPATGTILHPHKYKERLPLSELISNVPKYPLEPDLGIKTDSGTRPGTEERYTRPLGSQSYHLLEPPLASRLRSREGSEDRKGGVYLTPSDTSVDDSVKSGKVGKEVLLMYLNKTKPSRLVASDSEYTSPVEQFSPSHPSQQFSPSHSSQQFSPTYPAQYKLSKQGAEYYHLPTSHVSRPSSAGFSPYFPTQAPTTLPQHQIMSSPRYNSPPPLLPTASSGEHLLGSPIPRQYEEPSRLYPPLDPPQSSVSPTTGLYHHSPSPSLDMFRLLPHPHSYQSPAYHHQHQSPYSVPGLYPSSAGSSTILIPPHTVYSYKPQDDPVTPPTYDYSRSLRYPESARVPRIRIPSTPSVGSRGSAYKISSGSLSDRSSPLPSYTVEILAPGRGASRSSIIGFPSEHKPSPGEIRQIHIEKSCEQLGIKIVEGGLTRGGPGSRGVFVSSVSSNSLASQAGLKIGDQLLEVCGINLRMANYDQAAQVLHRVGNSIDIKVQYNPDKFLLDEDSGSNQEDEEDESSEDDEDEDDLPHKSSPRSGSPTPRNSPKLSAKFSRNHSTNSTLRGPILSPSAHSTLTHHQVGTIVAALARNPPVVNSEIRNHPGLTEHRNVQQMSGEHSISPQKLPPPDHTRTPSLTDHTRPPNVAEHSRGGERSTQSPHYREQISPQYHEPRLVYPVLKKSGDLGVRLVGGNAVGIFIHSVDIDSPAYNIGLRCADQILEYNGTDLRHATAEQAAYELAKPAENVCILAQYCPEKYNSVKDHPGDSYYVRAMFDRTPESNQPYLLQFKKDDILFVENTMYNGVPGHWSAWLLGADGEKLSWGIIPSKYKVEEELLLKRPISDIDSDGSRRSSTSTRRSFFKRRKGGRSSSRDSKELASYSDVASFYADSEGGPFQEESPISSYVRVEKFDYVMTRPVLIVGPLADTVVNKLVSDRPHKFVRCQPELLDGNMAALEAGMMENVFVDFRRRGAHYECTSFNTIREISSQNQHCILDIHLASVERLHHNHIFPIVLLIKFKSAKQIKEVKDPRYNAEKMTQKDAKNIFELTSKLETEYRHVISDVIQASANFMLMCTQIATKIEQEQNKTLWVPTGTIW